MPRPKTLLGCCAPMPSACASRRSNAAATRQAFRVLPQPGSDHGRARFPRPKTDWPDWFLVERWAGRRPESARSGRVDGTSGDTQPIGWLNRTLPQLEDGAQCCRGGRADQRENGRTAPSVAMVTGWLATRRSDGPLQQDKGLLEAAWPAPTRMSSGRRPGAGGPAPGQATPGADQTRRVTRTKPRDGPPRPRQQLCTPQEGTGYKGPRRATPWRR